MEKPYLSVIIPAYNESKRISKTLLDVDRYLSHQKFTYEIMVIDDGSKDNMDDVVNGLKKLIRNLELVRYTNNRGKGYAVRVGILKATGQFRLFMDADNSTAVNHFDKAKPLLEQGYQLVIGTRDARDNREAGQAIPQPLLRRLLGDGGNLLIQLLAVSGIWDTQCGFKVFTEKAAQDIFSRSQIDRWGFDIEALALSRKIGYKIGLIPVHWVNDADSRVNLRGYLNTFRELFKIKWNLMTGKYDREEQKK